MTVHDDDGVRDDAGSAEYGQPHGDHDHEDSVMGEEGRDEPVLGRGDDDREEPSVMGGDAAQAEESVMGGDAAQAEESVMGEDSRERSVMGPGDS